MKFKSHQAVLVLFLIGFGLRLYVCFNEPFLHDWDEKYHALVSRNLMDRPLQPLLNKDTVFEHDFKNWGNNTIWLHKQPLFLWQMALSLKVFGIHILSVRLPSIIMSSLMILLLYSTTLLIIKNNQIALIAALLFCFSNFQIKLCAGIQSLDHNDVAFEFYVLASVWAFYNYRFRSEKYWLILIGLFSGCAIMNKWLAGLFVFLIWGLTILWNEKRKGNRLEIIHFLFSLMTCFIVFLPWQIYILHQFPIEALYEYNFNNRHLYEIIENHSGNLFYYISHLPLLLGEGIWLLIFYGSFWIIYKNKVAAKSHYPIIISLLFVFVFFSVFVKTKFESLLNFIVPYLFILIAIGVFQLKSLIKNKWLSFLFLTLIITLSLNPYNLFENIFSKNVARLEKIKSTNYMKNIKNYLPIPIKIILNYHHGDHIEQMFYQNDITAIEGLLNERELAKINVPFAVLNDGHLPNYILNNPLAYIISNAPISNPSSR